MLSVPTLTDTDSAYFQCFFIKQCQFAKLNDKRYHFSGGIVSFPFGHPFLSKFRNNKRKAREKKCKKSF